MGRRKPRALPTEEIIITGKGKTDGMILRSAMDQLAKIIYGKGLSLCLGRSCALVRHNYKMIEVRVPESATQCTERRGHASTYSATLLASLNSMLAHAKHQAGVRIRIVPT